MRKVIFVFIVLLTASVLQAQTQNQNPQELEEIMRLTKEVPNLFMRGKNDEALEKAKRELFLREKNFGADSKETAVAHNNLGAIYQRKADYPAAIKHLEKALEICKKFYGENHSSTKSVLSDLGYAYFYNNDLSNAEKAFQKAFSVSDLSFGKETKEAFNKTLALARSYRKKGEITIAAHLYKLSVDIAEVTFAKNSKEKEEAFDEFTCYTHVKGIDETEYYPISLEDGDDLDPNKGVVNGKALSLPKPSFPLMARGGKGNALVIVRVTIDENGKVIKAKAICGHPVFKGASEDAAKDSLFTPTTLNGKPVKVTGYIHYRFIS